MKKTEILMKKPVYLRLIILELSKILIYDFWFDYIKPKLVKNQSTILWIEKVSLYTQKQVTFIKTRFDTSIMNYELELYYYRLECNPIDRPFPKRKKKKVIGLMKDEQSKILQLLNRRWQ